MSSEFKGLQIKRYPKLAKRHSKEGEYWKKFQFPVIVKEYSAISQVDFCDASPKDFLVACSGKIQVFSSTTNQVKKTITRFKDSLCCGKFRKDGKLIVAGFENGGVKVFDASSRTILRQFKPHTKAVHVTGFVPERSQIFSSSDDCTIRCTDIPTQKEILCLQGHKDYIRTGDSSPSNNSVLLTGSYDHTVKLWDVRSQSCALSLDHGNPVESVLLYPNCGMCISAGGNVIKVWDILAGGQILFNFSNHQKTITSMCFDGSYTRLLSGSIDRHLKIYDTTDFSVVASLDYPSAITSIGLSQNGSHLVAGMADGLISIKERIKPKEHDDSLKIPAVPRRGTHKYFVRGESDQPQEGDFVIDKEKFGRYSKVDRLLRRFEYRAALDLVLKKGDREAPKVIGLLLELARRDGLEIALSNRDSQAIVPILEFIIKHICNPQYSNMLTDITELILDIYTPVIGQSEEADKLFARLKSKLNSELDYQKQAFEVLGAIDALASASKIDKSIEAVH